MTPDHDPVSNSTVLLVTMMLLVALLFTGCASTCITKTTAQVNETQELRILKLEINVEYVKTRLDEIGADVKLLLKNSRGVQ